MTSTESRAATHAEIVTGIYASFGRGDIPAVLDLIADDAVLEDWPDHVGQQAGVAWLQRRRGPAGFAEFFAGIADWTPNAFDVLDVLAGERQVAVEVHADWTLPSGRRLVDDEVHLWTLDGAGKVIRMRHYVDTAKHIAAAGSSDTQPL